MKEERFQQAEHAAREREKARKKKRKKNLLRSVRLNLVLAGGIACDEQDSKGMIANDERERKKKEAEKGKLIL